MRVLELRFAGTGRLLSMRRVEEGPKCDRYLGEILRGVYLLLALVYLSLGLNAFTQDARADTYASGTATCDVMGAPYYDSASATLQVSAVTAAGRDLILGPGGSNHQVYAGTALVVGVIGGLGHQETVFNGVTYTDAVFNTTAPAVPGSYPIAATFHGGLFCPIDLALSGVINVIAAPVVPVAPSTATAPAPAASTPIVGVIRQPRHVQWGLNGTKLIAVFPADESHTYFFAATNGKKVIRKSCRMTPKRIAVCQINLKPHGKWVVQLYPRWGYAKIGDNPITKLVTT
jgi:hypothetical protein